MLTCKSPRKVLLAAYHTARRVLPNYSCKFSRHDYTWPQLFACLVLREHQKKSYRGIEALLRDVHWGKQIGLSATPDHNTLCRAFRAIMNHHHVTRILDVLARLMQLCRWSDGIVAIDSTYFDTHHHSRHYEHRCRQHAGRDKKTADQKRSLTAKKTPKLMLSVQAGTHMVLAARTQVGMSGDQKEFVPLLFDSYRRLNHMETVVADSGFDSHENHVAAREELGVCSLIKAEAGRPTEKPATSPYRQAMKEELAGSQRGRCMGIARRLKRSTA